MPCKHVENPIRIVAVNDVQVTAELANDEKPVVIVDR